MEIKVLNSSNFEDTIKNSEIPVLVDFYADWCGPCKRIAPTLEEIASEKTGQVMICKVDVDQSQSIAHEYQVMSIPNLIVFKNGEVSKRAQGAISKSDLLALIN